MEKNRDASWRRERGVGLLRAGGIEPMRAHPVSPVTPLRHRIRSLKVVRCVHRFEISMFVLNATKKKRGRAFSFPNKNREAQREI